MIKLGPKEVYQEFVNLFGEPTEAKMMFLYRFSRHCTGRCRNSAAYRNFINSCFPMFHQELMETGKFTERGPEKHWIIRRK